MPHSPSEINYSAWLYLSARWTKHNCRCVLFCWFICFPRIFYVASELYCAYDVNKLYKNILFSVLRRLQAREWCDIILLLFFVGSIVVERALRARLNDGRPPAPAHLLRRSRAPLPHQLNMDDRHGRVSSSANPRSLHVPPVSARLHSFRLAAAPRGCATAAVDARAAVEQPAAAAAVGGGVARHRSCAETRVRASVESAAQLHAR